MPALSRAWHAICRFIARSNTTVAIDAGTGRTGNDCRRDGALEILRAGSRRLYRLCAPFKEWMRDAQQESVRVALDARRNERRAKRKALILLLRQLNPEQRQEFRTFRYFHVIGAGSRDRYRIRMDMVANIDVLRNDGTVKYRLCARPIGEVPVYDVMAGQLLHLQDAGTEPRFLQQANLHPTLTEEQVRNRATWLV